MITEEHTKRIGDGAYPETVRALAEKWGPIFGVPPSWVISHAWVESKNRPKAMNPAGPAWGLMQIKLPTAEDIANGIKFILRETKNGHLEEGDPRRPADPALVAKVLKQWHGNGEDLFNPELAMMFATYYLSVLISKLGEYGKDQKIVAAAYNQGRGAVMKALREGKLTPKMKTYVAEIERAKEEGFS